MTLETGKSLILNQVPAGFCFRVGLELDIFSLVVALKLDVSVLEYQNTTAEQQPACTSFEPNLHEAKLSDKTERPMKRLICMQRET